MLKKTRQIVATVCLILVTLLFLDFTGTAQTYFGWIAKLQFLPAVLSLNLVVIIALILLTLLFGRLYCSIICPLGIMQDIFAWFGKKAKKNRYTYSAPKNVLRYVMLAIMIIAIILGINVVVTLLAPYSAYGRIVASIFSPLWIWGNNILAKLAEMYNSYAFYTVDLWIKGLIPLIVGLSTLIVLTILAWRNGRTYCNTICPVGTTLSFIARFSIFRPFINRSKCVNCNLCARNCKAACIDIKNGHSIDYSRCVTCFDCIYECKKGAITYTAQRKNNKLNNENKIASTRRQFLSLTAILATSRLLHAKEKKVDGGLALITEKKAPKRATKIAPPGAISLRNVANHCTACQLCISECPNGVLRPSVEISSFMQPEVSYERGYCRPECVRCSQACPTGAIRPITTATKAALQIGHAVWVKKNCIPLTDGVECGNCARHCPAAAITMVDSSQGVKIPVINTEVCIGCGACENLCPARPFSAIYVEGHENHRTI